MDGTILSYCLLYYCSTTWGRL